MHTFVVEAASTGTLAALSVAFAKLLPVIHQHVVLARHKERLFGICTAQHLIESVEFGRLGKMA
jgi:hypothetical protein